MEPIEHRSPPRSAGNVSAAASPGTEQARNLASLSLAPHRLRSILALLPEESTASCGESAPCSPIKLSTRRGPVVCQPNASGPEPIGADTDHPATPVCPARLLQRLEGERDPALARSPCTERCSRVNVRESKKEAIAASMALDFVSLASCDKVMVQECDDGHTQLEALKRKRARLPGRSQEETNRLRMLPLTISAPQFKCISSVGSSEIHGVVKRMKQPPRVASSGTLSSGGPSSESYRLGSAPPHPPRSGSGSGSIFAIPRRAVSSHGHSSMHAVGHSRMGSTHGSMESFSIFTNHEATMVRCSTPPGAPTAFEAHTQLVKCLAPKAVRRGAAFAPSTPTAPQ